MKPIRIGIIGAGFARSTQIPGFAHCRNATLVAIASARREHAEQVAREFSIPHVAEDWRGVVERDDVDLISIVTPVVTHCEMALAALDRRKHVLCEKPMAMNAAEARRMTERAGDQGVLALIDHELRFLPGRLLMREMIRQGEIGRIKHAGVVFRADSRADPDRPWNWWSEAKQGGGALGAIGSHIIDGFRWMLSTEVESVMCQLATHILERKDHEGTDRPVTSDDEANLLMRFADSELTEGATGNVSISMVEPGKPLHRFEVFGERGALRVEGDGELWQAKIGEGVWKKVSVPDGELAPGMSDNPWARGFTVFAQQIVDALHAGRATVDGAATFADGHRTQLVLDAAREANASRCWKPTAEQSPR
ncbi:MAG TPA: Gfo/Idh/MocA family oxidoreductase [Pyrinomonadaceae bacterium]|nr:Gfo/Idh/MocA family oxidoreductase [Pyrinomonadaceae bacterium]